MKLSTRLTIAMVALVLVTIAVSGVLTYRNLLSIAVPRSLERLGGHVLLLATELEAVVRGARADVLGFALDGMVDGGSGDITDRSSIFAAVERRRLASRFSAELTAKPWYDDLRMIGIADGGREIVRVSRSGAGGAIRAATDARADHAGWCAIVCPRWSAAWNCDRQSRLAAGVRSNSRGRPPRQPYLRRK
jgi:hypothetical protein